MSYRKLPTHPLRALLRGTLALGAVAPLAVLANPTGGQVVGGTATIGGAGANGLVINQGSQKAIINWQQFSVGSNEYVQFVQPNSSSVVLNRVVGSNPSSIFGNIIANGQVFLVNSNGVYFAPGASIDVQGLVASTLDLNDADFMAGRYLFSKAPGAPDAGVVNGGSIHAGRGGYVVLAGDYAQNSGAIVAQTGRVYLAAGNAATLTFDQNQLISYVVDGQTLSRLAGVSNTGVIAANGGAVVMTADVANALTATAVNNSGLITAHSVINQGGTIVLLARGGDIENSGTLDASATQAGVAGGTVIVHADGKTELTSASVITTAGDGAQGGFIDLSGHDLAIRGKVDAGKGGMLLLDPASINITSGGTNGAASGNPNNVGINFLAGQLNAGNNIEVIATNKITYTGSPGKTLTASGSLAAGKQLAIEIGTIASCGNGVCVGPPPFISVISPGTITLTGLAINIKGNVNIQTQGGTVTVDAITANGGITIGGGKITINGNLAAAGGSLDVNSNPTAPGGGFIKAIGKSLSGQRVNLNVSATSFGGTISVGAISATVHIGINAAVTTGTSADTIKVGPISAPNIAISASGRHETITTGPIAASNATGPALVKISETVLAGGSGNITVGPVFVSGKPGASIGALTQFDLPLVAGLFINAGGSGANDVRNVHVNGAIDVVAQGAAYHAGSCECGTPNRRQSGTGGLAAAFITVAGSHGAASVTGGMSIQGPDALAGVEAASVTVHNVSVTGSGHQVTRAMGPFVTSGAYASSNSAGQADLILGTTPSVTSHGPSGVSASVKAGNITVAGKGLATARLFATNVSAGNISVTATAAKGKITQNSGVVTYTSCASHCVNANSSNFYRDISHMGLHLGSIDAGRADILVAGGTGTFSSSNGAQALNVKLGTLSVNGVGEARVAVTSKAIQTGAVSVIATKGTEKGTGSSVSGTHGSNHFAHSFDINGGQAAFRIRSGGSGSGAVLTQNGGPVTINGAVTIAGPEADVDMKGKTITIGGNLTVTGSGESFMSDTVVTGTKNYHAHVTGASAPLGLFMQGATSGSVSVAGRTMLKGPGLIAAFVAAGGVKLHGVDASASAAVTYSVLDTRVAATAQTFTAGSVALVTADVAAAAGKPVFTSASNVGDVVVKAKGDVDLASRLKLSGGLNVRAGGNIFGSSNNFVTRFKTLGNAHAHAGSGGGSGGPSPGSLPTLTLNANAAYLQAGGNISLSGSKLSVGTGVVVDSKGQALQPGDAALLAVLAHAGLSPASGAPNVAFIGGGNVSLGGLTLTGSYLYLQAAQVALLGPVSVPVGALVQLQPADPAGVVDIVGTAAAAGVSVARASGTNFTLSPAFISQFAHATVAVGGTGESGDVFITGTVGIGDTNLVIDTSGIITGLGHVTSTGLIISVEPILSAPVPPPTSGEIDPNSSNNNNAADKKQQGGDTGTGGQQGGTVSQTSDAGGACH